MSPFPISTRNTLLLATLLALCVPLTACKRSLDEAEVLAFIDKADAAARKRYALEICELRGETFSLQLTFQADETNRGPSDLTMDRKLFCKEAGKFSRLQYQLERKSLDIEVASDRKTARVNKHYVETMPYYDLDIMPATPDDFRKFQIVESYEEARVGIEGGELVFLSSDTDSTQTLVDKYSLSIPYN
ncbi:MAG TPA: hypothetical protein VFS58_13005 [Steroidobacteraceae bacterium]|nr:hypothetical protein [Steroidobacteraceae bacterium]